MQLQDVDGGRNKSSIARIEQPVGRVHGSERARSFVIVSFLSVRNSDKGGLSETQFDCDWVMRGLYHIQRPILVSLSTPVWHRKLCGIAGRGA